MSDDTSAVYEMFWDCAYCGTRKLLGKTHRFCPGCGAPQDPGKRYFPSDQEKVAVRDHVYVGADRLCQACGAAMSALAAHCTQCGSPMEGGAEVRRVAEAPPTPPAPPPIPPAPSGPARSGSCFGISCGVLAVLGALLLAVLVTALCWKKKSLAEVTAHDWQRTAFVEALRPAPDDAWCNELPQGAYGVSKRRAIRSHQQIPDGQDCTTRPVDQGDGTFRELQQCTPRYRDQPVYDLRCDFTIDRWTRTRSAQASGRSLADAPAWPDLSLRPGSCRGCEREGGREESYRVQFRADDGKSFSCTLPEDRWRSFAVGSRWEVTRGAVTGAPSCSSLRPAER